MSLGLDYGLWCLQQETGELELDSMRAEVCAAPRPPLISVLLVAGRLDELWVAEGVESLARQTYPHWELCAGQFGSRSTIDEVLEGRLASVDNVRTTAPFAGGSYSSALARALSVATGDYVLIVDEGDELPRDALLRVVAAIHDTGADLIYSNEDRIDAHGVRSAPSFKHGFSPDRLLCAPYLGRLCAIRSELVDAAGGIQPALGPVAEHHLLLSVAERARRVVHLPRILYHRRVLASADGRVVWGLPDQPPADATVAVVEAALERRGERAVARADRDAGAVRVVRRPPADVEASLILCPDGRTTEAPILRQLERRSSTRVDEVIVSGQRRSGDPGMSAIDDPCPARAANRAASDASGDVLIFCAQSATLPPTAGPRWVGELVAQAARPEVGAVSGTVVDAEGRLRHGGVRVDLAGLAGPVSRDQDIDPLSAASTLNPGGASGDLLAIRQETFERAGGFDDEHLPGSLFALDLAFRLEETGLTSVYTPVAQILCRAPWSVPSPEEIEYMWARWGSRINRLLDYERSPFDPHRPVLAPEHPGYATFATARSEGSA